MTLMIRLKHIEAKNIKRIDFQKEIIHQYILALNSVFSETMSFEEVKKSLVKLLDPSKIMFNKMPILLSAKYRRLSCYKQFGSCSLAQAIR